MRRGCAVSRVLAFSQPWAGHVYAMVPTLLELERRGHEVAIAMPAPHGASICRWGLDAEHLAAVVGALVAASLPTADGGSAAHAELASAWGAPAAEALARLIATERPDCILVDPILWGGMIAAEASGLPWAKVAHSCLLIPTTGVRLQGAGLAPPRSLRERVSRYATALVAARQADAAYLPMVNAVRDAHGLPPVAHVEDSTRRAPLTLAFTGEPFEYPRRDWHPSVRFVGPSLWDPPVDPGVEKSLPLDDGRPLILVSSSSLPQADSVLVSVALEALAGESTCVVATVPPDFARRPVPPNATLVRRIAHSQLLPRAACVICHGGHGTTLKALAHGVPVVAVPFGRDQFEVARRVEVAAAGVRLVAQELTPDRLGAAVRQATRQQLGAQRIAEAFRRTGGAAAAASAVLALVAHSAPGISAP